MKLILLGFTLLFVRGDPGRNPRRSFDDHDSDLDDFFDELNRPEFQDIRPIQPDNNIEELWNLNPLEDLNNNQPVPNDGRGLGYQRQASGDQEPPQIGSEVMVVEGRRMGIQGNLQAISGNRAILLDENGETHNVLVSHIRALHQGKFLNHL